MLPAIKASGLYHVDRAGRVWTCRKLSNGVYSDRWRRCDLSPTGIRGRPQINFRGKSVYASRLVYFWFHGPIGGLEVDHDNNDVRDNRPENLRLLTRLRNQQKAERDGLVTGARYPSDNRKRAARDWWRVPGVREKMSLAARRGWLRRKVK